MAKFKRGDLVVVKLQLTNVYAKSYNGLAEIVNVVQYDSKYSVYDVQILNGGDCHANLVNISDYWLVSIHEAKAITHYL